MWIQLGQSLSPPSPPAQNTSIPGAGLPGLPQHRTRLPASARLVSVNRRQSLDISDDHKSNVEDQIYVTRKDLERDLFRSWIWIYRLWTMRSWTLKPFYQIVLFYKICLTTGNWDPIFLAQPTQKNVYPSVSVVLVSWLSSSQSSFLSGFHPLPFKLIFRGCLAYLTAFY